MDKKKGIIVLLIAVVAVLYFGGYLTGDSCTIECEDDVTCEASKVEGCKGYVAPDADATPEATPEATPPDNWDD